MAESPQRIDPATVAALYEEHARELRAFLLGVLRNAELADDALQSTFAKAVEHGHTAHEEARKGWLFRVAFNEAMQIKRRSGIDRRATRKVAEEVSPSPIGELSDEGLQQLVRAEVVELVRGALDTLPEAQREVVRKRVYEDKTFAVIAEELGLPLGTVLTRMRLAIRKLALRLRDSSGD